MPQQILTIETRGRGFEMITSQVANVVSGSGVKNGLCNVFIRHTSASVLITASYSERVELPGFVRTFSFTPQARGTY